MGKVLDKEEGWIEIGTETRVAGRIRPDVVPGAPFDRFSLEVLCGLEILYGQMADVFPTPGQGAAPCPDRGPHLGSTDSSAMPPRRTPIKKLYFSKNAAKARLAASAVEPVGACSASRRTVLQPAGSRSCCHSCQPHPAYERCDYSHEVGTPRKGPVWPARADEAAPTVGGSGGPSMTPQLKGRGRASAVP